MSPVQPENRFKSGFQLKKKSTRKQGGKKGPKTPAPAPVAPPKVTVDLDAIAPQIKQISQVLEQIASTPLEVIIVGDERDTPESGEEDRLEQLKKAHQEYKREKKLREYLQMREILQSEEPDK